VLIRTSACLFVLAFTVGVTGCGDDEEDTDARSTITAPSAPVVTGEETTEGTAELPPSTSPEEQEGGAGDEEEARSEVELEFTSRGLEPPIVRVAPFIAVKLIVRSVDGAEYNLTVSGPTSGGGANGTTEADLDLEGLRPGQKYEVRERNTGSVSAIVASDDVGP
jgi:hypothetical protein